MNAQIADAIRGLQGGDLSRNEFFARIDRTLAAEPNSSVGLLDMLGEERTRAALPADVLTELQQRAAHVAHTHPSGPQSPSGNPASWSQPTASADPGTQEPPGAVERMKGVGDTLNGRFVLEECVGFGGMGTVYKALDLRKLEASDRKPYIAIKVLNVQFRGHPKSLIALQREARKAQTLAHPNIVTVYDFDRDGSMVYLTMEYLTGKPLSQVLRAPGFSGMPVADAMRIVTGIGKALAYAHERGFVHCDLKPANVFLLEKGDVKVIDFGIARVFHKTEEDAEATVFDAGSLGGLTPAYASPEMIEHLDPDPRDDIYALACITYELLTGTHPFNRMSATQARSAGMRPARPKQLSYRQWRALRCALSFERASRTPSVTQYMQEMSGSFLSPLLTTVAVAGSTGAAFAALILIYVFVLRGEDANRQAEPAPQAPAAPVVTTEAIAPVLAEVPCSALSASVAGSSVRVQGYLSAGYGQSRLKERLSEVPGVSAVALDVQPVQAQACPVMEALAPYWSPAGAAAESASIRSRAANAELAEGDSLIVDITTPAHQSYVYVDYYALDGAVAHLVPSRRAREHLAPPNHKAAVGSLGNWVISEPFGKEMIVLVTSPAPLFSGLRDDVEKRDGYLRALQSSLKDVAAKHGKENITVDFLPITTHARKR